VAFTETDEAPARELLERFVEVVLVRRAGTHTVPNNGGAGGGRVRVGEFPGGAAGNRAQVATGHRAIGIHADGPYAADCAPARPILVEHDVTFDLYQQLNQDSQDWDLRHQVILWRRYETAAWRDMSCVVTMSEKDRGLVTGARASALPMGVDLDRFRVSTRDPESRRLLFVGSFSHVAQLMAVRLFSGGGVAAGE